MNGLKAAALVAMALMAGAAARDDGRHRTPPGSVAQVELRFDPGYTTGQNLDPRVVYSIAAAGDCRPRQAAAIQQGQKAKKTKVEAGRPILVTGTTRYISAYYLHSCQTQAVFTPVSGRRYRVMNAAPFQSQACLLVVKDIDTNEEPADLVQGRGAACPKEWRRPGFQAAIEGVRASGTP